MTRPNPYEVDLERNPANCAPLTPLTFIEWSASVYPDRTAVIHGARRYSWKETYARCRRLASALAKRGIGVGDTVAAMLPNTPEMYECHFGVPMAGAVLNTLNTRLDADAIAFMLNHGEAKALITDREFSGTIAGALEKVDRKPIVIDVDDPEYAGPGERLGRIDYEAFLAEGDPAYAWQPPADEWQAISLNYTSGTTGNPKGVVYSHRGAYLNGVGNLLTWNMPRQAVYLWTLPMFHCNGWCFPWSMAANAGTNVCLRKVEPGPIFELIREHRVTHYCGAPIVHSALINADPKLREGIGHKVSAFVAGALIGAGVALLFAPQTGTELRGMLRNYASRAKDEAWERGRSAWDSAIERGKEYYEKGQEAVQEAGRSAREYAQSGKEAMRESREGTHRG